MAPNERHHPAPHLGGGNTVRRRNIANSHHQYWAVDGGVVVNASVVDDREKVRRKREEMMANGWRALDAVSRHRLPCLFSLCVLIFMQVEYSLVMVPYSSPPFDVGFVLTRPLNRFLAAWPDLNSALAALNTVFVAMQSFYILWCLVAEWRPRATIAAAFMFTCRGILGYCTQLPLPQEFLGSGMDFPVGNVSFFLFYSGHVAAAVIASIDMRRAGRKGMAWGFDALNAMQVVRLLATRGHYTIDLAVGVGAGVLFDYLAGKYLAENGGGHAAAEEGMRGRRKSHFLRGSTDSSCCCCGSCERAKMCDSD